MTVTKICSTKRSRTPPVHPSCAPSQIPEDAEASPVAPEICIEVLSQSNTAAEIDEKRGLYFDRGALEVWTCDADGDMRFFTASGEQPASALVPDFPTHIDL